MKSLKALSLALALTVGFAGFAQAQDKDAVKKKILDKVEKKIRESDKKLLAEIEKLLDKELGTRETPRRTAERRTPRRRRPQAAPRRNAKAGYLGIQVGEVDEGLRTLLGLDDDEGVLIADVLPDTAADKAGFEADDVIVKIDGETVGSTQDLIQAIGSKKAGEKVRITFVRDERRKTKRVTLGSRPDDQQAPRFGQEEEGEEEGEGDEGDLRKRIQKFLKKNRGGDQEETPRRKRRKRNAPRKEEQEEEETPSNPFGGLDFDSLLNGPMGEQILGQLEQFGIDPDMIIEEDDEGNKHLRPEIKEMLKNFNPQDFQDQFGDQFGDLFKNSPFGQPGEEEEEEEEAPRKRKTATPWLGVQIEEVSGDLAEQLDLDEGDGLVILDVVEDSPADDAGLRTNDVLVKIGRKSVHGEDTLANFMKKAKVGDEVKLTVLRKGRRKHLTLTIGERED